MDKERARNNERKKTGEIIRQMRWKEKTFKLAVPVNWESWGRAEAM